LSPKQRKRLRSSALCCGIPLTSYPTTLCAVRFSHRSWRAKQAEEIAQREEASAKKREETIVKAQNAIDNFYKDYNQKKEQNIARNKCVT
jgi:hypothetical protein